MDNNVDNVDNNAHNNFFKRGMDLSLAVYRVTDMFPKDEILRNRMRALCVDINDFFVYNIGKPAYSGRIFNYEDLEDKIKILDSYCLIAKRQGWMNDRNFDILRDEYKKLWIDIVETFAALQQRAEIRGQKHNGSENTKRREKAEVNRSDLSEKQKNILRIIKENPEGATIQILADSLKTSKKTVERNLKALIKKSLVKKLGQTRKARFFIKN